VTIEADVLRALATAHVSDEEDAAIQEQALRCLRGEHSPVVVASDLIECALCREVLVP